MSYGLHNVWEDSDQCNSRGTIRNMCFCDVTKNRRRFAGHQHFGKRNVEEHHNERDVVKNMEMLVGKRGHVSFQTWG
jgi:hypothetical protein